MAEVLIRDLDKVIIDRLKTRAQQHRRSLQAELKTILEQAAEVDRERAKKLAARLRRKLAGRNHSDSGELQAEDRRR